MGQGLLLIHLVCVSLINVGSGFYQNLNFSFLGQLFQYYLLGLNACRLRFASMGNGESIKIYGDNWLPIASFSGVHDPLPSEFQNASVSSLINHQTRTWDLEILSTTLTPFEADLVQKITLSRGQSRDVLFWPFVQSGIYSVKSSYYFLKFEARFTATQVQAPLDHPKPP